MSASGRLLEILNTVLNHANVALLRKSTLEEVRSRADLFQRMFGDDASLLVSGRDEVLPAGAEDYLRSTNPRLTELKQKYAALTLPVADRSFWSEELIHSEVDLQYFRADSAYVWQHRDMNTALNYVLAAYYLRTIDSLRLFERLEEDGLFGASVTSFNDLFLISRDLLDSLTEIYFLERHVQLSSLPSVNILDIGAGYGRFAHRLVTGLPNVGACYCVDSVPESTFISEYYLKFRGVADRARVVPLFEIEEVLAANRIDIAVNIHSFTECSMAAIAGWVELVRRHRIRYLMVVPNGEDHEGQKLLSRERDDRRLDFLPVIRTQGYELRAMEPKYLDRSVQKYGPSPTSHYLFELS